MIQSYTATILFACHRDDAARVGPSRAARWTWLVERLNASANPEIQRWGAWSIGEVLPDADHDDRVVLTINATAPREIPHVNMTVIVATRLADKLADAIHTFNLPDWNVSVGTNE